ncbi:XdhC family protein [Sphingomicrobium sp. XHP0239]|uniref:XdhC family protein n=1 Tax=Sphingomicrobium maritimum TaxID=3133972 RepID=UPI0031CCA27D
MNRTDSDTIDAPAPDHRALVAACEAGTALCTIVGIDGAFSRRRGAQLAVRADGEIVGDLADTCLEEQLRTDVRTIEAPELRRYGKGSDKIDFRLPCGGGLDILLDPTPDVGACRRAVAALKDRRPAALDLPVPPLRSRAYVPALQVRIFGTGPEAEILNRLAESLDIATTLLTKDALALHQPSRLPPADRWTACVFLFHDHEWELALLEEATESEAFYIGAQGGVRARSDRIVELERRGLSAEAIGRIRSPIGVVESCRTPRLLALSALTEILADYDAMHDGD